MKVNRFTRTLFVVATLICAAHLPLASAQVSGDLGLWLHRNAGPGISDIVNGNPRFIGESIRIVALKDGQPSEIDNELVRRIRGLLQQALLENSTIRIPVEQAGTCHPRDVNIVLGIEVSEHNHNEHQILLAFLDVDENVWINQSTHLWTGRLTAEQRSLLSQPTNSVQTTFFEDDTNKIAAFCKKHHINKLSIFGSVLHDDLGPRRIGEPERRYAIFFAPQLKETWKPTDLVGAIELRYFDARTTDSGSYSQLRTSESR